MQKFLKAFSGLLLCAACNCANAQTPSYKNKNLSPEARAKHLLSLMTLDEKLMQTQCLWIQKSRILDSSGQFDPAKAKEALKTDWVNWQD